MKKYGLDVSREAMKEIIGLSVWLSLTGTASVAFLSWASVWALPDSLHVLFLFLSFLFLFWMMGVQYYFVFEHGRRTGKDDCGKRGDKAGDAEV